MGWHYEYVTHVSYVLDGETWPCPDNVVVGEWSHDYAKRIIKIDPYRAIQGGGGGQYSYHSHADNSVGLAVWWIEKTVVQDAPPPPPPATDYDKVREELGV